MMNWKLIASKHPINAYSIFCGELDYPKSLLKELEAGKLYGFKEWEIHVNPGNDKISSEEIIKGFDKFYYESFVNTIFPDHNYLEKRNIKTGFALETKRLSKKLDLQITINIRQKDYTILVEYLDLFFFPRGIVIYSFKCNLTEFSFDEITLINSYFRNGNANSDLQFVFDNLAFINPKDGTGKNKELMDFGNKLKVFSMVEHDFNFEEKDDENKLLYDLGTCSPIGTAAGIDSRFQPSEEYMQELLTNNKISVFKNWSALALLDTFTGVFNKGALNNFVWESGYFNLLYLQSLYVKHYLFKINKAFFAKNANHQKLESEFFEFNKYYNPSNISYNFLPPIIYEKIRFGLAIPDEMDQLRDVIERSNQKHKEKQDKMINDILTVIALLAVFSAIWDISEWVNKLFTGATPTYSTLSISLTVAILAILGIFLYRNSKKKI